MEEICGLREGEVPTQIKCETSVCFCWWIIKGRQHFFAAAPCHEYMKRSFQEIASLFCILHGQRFRL